MGSYTRSTTRTAFVGQGGGGGGGADSALLIRQVFSGSYGLDCHQKLGFFFIFYQTLNLAGLG